MTVVKTIRVERQSAPSHVLPKKQIIQNIFQKISTLNNVTFLSQKHFFETSKISLRNNSEKSKVNYYNWHFLNKE